MQTSRWSKVVGWALGCALGCAADSGEPEDGGTLGSDGATDTDDGEDASDAPDDAPDPSDPFDDDGDGDDGDDGDDPTSSSDGHDGPADSDDTSGTLDDGGPAADPPPTDPDALLAWLQAGTYLEWPAESGPHPSDGPHFGTVRTYVDDTLFASLQAGSAEHPVGAAAVKELYGNGDRVRGWSVMVKVALGAEGDGWYWYERYDGSVYGDGVGDGSCTGCHGSGHDFVRSPFPPQ